MSESVPRCVASAESIIEGSNTWAGQSAILVARLIFAGLFTMAAGLRSPECPDTAGYIAAAGFPFPLLPRLAGGDLRGGAGAGLPDRRVFLGSRAIGRRLCDLPRLRVSRSVALAKATRPSSASSSTTSRFLAGCFMRARAMVPGEEARPSIGALIWRDRRNIIRGFFARWVAGNLSR